MITPELIEEIGIEKEFLFDSHEYNNYGVFSGRRFLVHTHRLTRPETLVERGLATFMGSAGAYDIYKLTDLGVEVYEFLTLYETI
jgi:hypothetical protein